MSATELAWLPLEWTTQCSVRSALSTCSIDGTGMSHSRAEGGEGEGEAEVPVPVYEEGGFLGRVSLRWRGGAIVVVGWWWLRLLNLFLVVVWELLETVET